MRDIWRWSLTATGIAACPCHFPVTLPLVIGALGATGVGAVLADYAGWVYAAGWVYFVAAVAIGFIWTRSAMGKRGKPPGHKTSGLHIKRREGADAKHLVTAEGVGDAYNDQY